jgi:hypothetical protein
MERVSAVKETLIEFEGYLAAAQLKADSGEVVQSEADMMNDGNGDEGGEADDNEGEDEEDEEEEYGPSDFTFVGESVAVIRFSLELMKTGLAVMTNVGDSNARTSAETSSTGAAGTSTETAASVEDVVVRMQEDGAETGAGTGVGGEAFNCDQWVAKVCAQSDILETAVTDFGAALYPPLDVDTKDTLKQLASSWRDVAREYLRTLQQAMASAGDNSLQADQQSIGDFSRQLDSISYQSTDLFS